MSMLKMRGKRVRAIALIVTVVLVVVGLFFSGYLPLSPFGYSAITYDPATKVSGGTATYCSSSWFKGEGNTIPAMYNGNCATSSNPQTYNPLASNNQGFTSTAVTVLASSNDGCNACNWNPLATFNFCRGQQINLGSASYGGACAHADIAYTGTLSGGVQYPYNKVDSNFQNLYGEPPPSCNPCSIGSNNTYNFLVYEYGGDIRLTRSDNLNVNYNCFNTYSSFNVATQFFCTGAEIDALNSIIGQVNQNNNIGGTVVVDLTIPNSLALTSRDRMGIFAAWTAPGSNQAQNGCIIGKVLTTTTVSIAQCSSHLIIPSNLQFTPFAYASLGSFTAGQFSPTLIGQLSTTLQMRFTITSIQPQYSIGACGGTGQQSCIGNAPPAITGDTSIVVDIPFIFDVLDATPITCSAGLVLSNGNCVSPGCSNGQTLVKNATYPSGICVTLPQCPSPNTMVNGVCTPPSGANCPPPNLIVNGQCQSPGSAGICGSGFALVNGVCIQYGTCPSGYQPGIGGVCMSSTNQGQCGNSGAFNISGVGCPKLSNPNGNIIVHVTNTLGVALNGVSVGVSGTSGTSCLAAISNLGAGTTDTNGNWLFPNLPVTSGGTYNVCAIGNAGSLTLILFTVSVTFSPASTQCNTFAGGTTTCNLSLQTNVDVALTAFVVGIIVLVIAMIVVLVAVRPRQTATFVTGVRK